LVLFDVNLGVAFRARHQFVVPDSFLSTQNVISHSGHFSIVRSIVYSFLGVGYHLFRADSRPHTRSPSRLRPLAWPAATARIDLPVVGSRAASCRRRAANRIRIRRTCSRSEGLLISAVECRGRLHSGSGEP